MRLNQLQVAWWLAERASLPLAGASTHVVIEVELDDRAVIGDDLELLAQAWQRVVRAVPALRSHVELDGSVRLGETLPRFERVDLADAGAARASRLSALRQGWIDEDIPLAGPGPWRLTAVRLDPESWWLALRFNFALIDYASILQVLELWGRAFANLHAPLSASIYERPAGSVAALAATSASEELPELPPAPALDMARDPRSHGRPSPSRRELQLSPHVSARLSEVARTHGLSSSELVYGAFSLTLATWADCAPATLSVATFERDAASGIGDGCCLQLAITPALDRTSLIQWIRQAAEGWRGAGAQPHSMVLAAIRRRLERDGVGYPVVFTDLTVGAAPEGLTAGLRWLGRHVATVTRTPQVWLDCQLRREGDSLAVAWDCPRGLFDEGTLQAAFEGFGTALELLTDPLRLQEPVDLACGRLLPAAELELRARVNGTRVDWSPEQRDATLCSLVLDQMRRAPSGPAVITSAGTLSYAELVDEARRVATWVARSGGAPGENVAVWMHKGAAEVVAALGVLLAGRSYLPIDAALPSARQRQLASLGELSAIITQQGVEMPSMGLPLLELGTDPLPEATALDQLPGPDDRAYVVFTSGSTGIPKGVMIRHSSAVNTLFDVQRRFELTASDRSFGLSALSFDLSVWDVFGMLAVGGAVVIPTGSARRDPLAWRELVSAHGVTIWNTVPASLGALLDTIEAQGLSLPSSLRLAALSGDWIPLALPARLREHRPSMRVVSLGGATEGSIWSIAYEIDAIAPGWRSVPYGMPLANQTMHVLNAVLAQCPTGVAGELFIGGRGVAMGYLNDPERTAQSFIVHSRSGERLYRTGDYGRYLPDGNIEFLGRRDTQVKIQGHRIELGELEAVAGALPAVKHAVARAFGERDGRRWLALFVVPDRPGSVVESALREALLSQLPEPMVPSRIVVVEQLPLSPNGKIDRAALEVPEAPVPSGRPVAREPTALEASISEVWCRVLRVREVGLSDDFFSLGGDSLLAIQVASQLAARGVRLPAAAFFDHRTVSAQGKVAELVDPELHRPEERDDGAIPLGPGQRVILAHGFGELDAWNEGFILRASERLNFDHLARAFRAVVKHHALLRARIHAGGDGFRLEVSPAASSFELEHVVLDELPAAERSTALEVLARSLESRISLATGPVLVGALVSGGTTDPADRFVVLGHQLLIDGFSWRIVLEDLQTAYRALSRGDAATLPMVGSSFGSWTSFLERHAEAPGTLAELGLWMREHEAAAGDTPSDTALPPTAESLAFHHLTFDEDTSQVLLRRATRAHAVTAQELLLGVLAETLAAWTGRDRVGVDVLAHGREALDPSIDTSRTVGRFTTTFPLALEACPTFGESARAAARRLRALPDRGVRYALLRHMSGAASTALGEQPRPSVAFNYVGHFDPVLGERDVFASLDDLPKRRTLVGPRRHALELHGYVLNARLTLEWRYSTVTHTEATIRMLTASLEERLRREAERLHAEDGGVLVIGATGALGQKIAYELRSAGHAVTALVRDPSSARAAALAERGIELVAGTLADRAAIRAALVGCRAVVFSATGVDCKAGTGELESADRAGLAHAVEEAEATGVERFVYVSMSGGISVDNPMLRTKRLGEQRLQRSSLAWTVLRSTFFYETWLCSPSGIDPERAHAKLYGGGTQAVSYIAQHDVARAACHVLSAPSFERRVVQLGGPMPVVPCALLERLERGSESSFEIEHFDVERLRASAEAATEPVLSSVLALRAAHGLGDVVDPAWASELGLTLTSVEEWLEARGVPIAPVVT